jgi:hypothetical protein
LRRVAGAAGALAWPFKQGRKQFFFEKKNQKTFTQLVNAADTIGTYQNQ